MITSSAKHYGGPSRIFRCCKDALHHSILECMDLELAMCMSCVHACVVVS